MSKKTNLTITLKWLISLFISVGIGSFITDVLGKISMNVWISRGVGAIICVIISLIFYYFWLKKNNIEKS